MLLWQMTIALIRLVVQDGGEDSRFQSSLSKAAQESSSLVPNIGPTLYSSLASMKER
jgi:hypothetical protein